MISLILGLVVLAFGIFNFIEENDRDAYLFLYLAVYAYLLSFYFFKSLYYRSQSATFNELFFVVGLPIVPIILSVVTNLLHINQNFETSTLIFATINIGQTREFYVHITGLLALPFYIFSLYLLLRTFIRYKFIRWTPYSNGGIPATFLGIIISLSIGFAYVLLSLYLYDLLLLIFGLMYALVGVLGFFA